MRKGVREHVRAQLGVNGASAEEISRNAVQVASERQTGGAFHEERAEEGPSVI
jgi:hypothetical protein